ncbi:benzoate transporter [Croceibacterium mercuriale]|uniref:Benzoate transporter n=1 Tax=Croceibacterium mercuriale TaxID=1572751 RepID=A0A0B2BZJ9_9SPHN|nr:benzoate/H(+) symporter BenE family transporter [Croceibacterium mercuriale]KHL25457.1 benzoate transporter [Croceibacterium mercuriale]
MRDTLPPLSAWTSALVATAVGFGGTIALVVQAIRGMGATVEQTGSAITALCLAIAVAGGALSLRLRIPVVLAWSTPGAALLVTAPPTSWPVACGAFALAGLIGVAFGAVPFLGRLAGAIPPPVASAMLAGVLLPFGLETFRQADADPFFVLLLCAIFVAARQRVPLYALLLVLAVGVALTLARGDLGELPAGATFGSLVPAGMAFDAGAILSIALPLFVVTLVSQNLPGIAVLQLAGYSPRPGPLVVGTGLASVAAAPFGAHAVNLAAITAALCTSPDADPAKERRWRVGLIYAGFYLLLAIFAPALVRTFLALPHTAIAVLTGLAIVPTLTAALEAMLKGSEHRDATILTLLVTASGLTLYGIGSAFWGITAGLGTIAIARLLRVRRTAA